MKTPVLLTLAATLCLALSSCVPISESPLSSIDTAQADTSLIGTWINEPDQEAYHITSKQSPWLHVDVLNQSGATTDSYDFYSTTIGKNHFANVLYPDNPKAKTYTLIRYALSGNTLTIWSMSSKLCAAAIKSGKLKGSVTEDKNPDVTLISDSETLVKFIKRADLDKLFTNKDTLTKIESK